MKPCNLRWNRHHTVVHWWAQVLPISSSTNLNVFIHCFIVKGIMVMKLTNGNSILLCKEIYKSCTEHSWGYWMKQYLDIPRYCTNCRLIFFLKWRDPKISWVHQLNNPGPIFSDFFVLPLFSGDPIPGTQRVDVCFMFIAFWKLFKANASSKNGCVCPLLTPVSWDLHMFSTLISCFFR